MHNLAENEIALLAGTTDSRCLSATFGFYKTDRIPGTLFNQIIWKHKRYILLSFSLQL